MIDYNWRSPSQRIEMSNQYGWKQRQIPPSIPGGAPGPAPTLPPSPQTGPLPGSQFGGRGIYAGYYPGYGPSTSSPSIPGGTPGPTPSFNPWQDSGVGSGGNNPLDFTVPTDSHNIVQIPGLPPVQNPPIESGDPQASNPTGYAQGGVIPPGLERYRKLLKGNWRPKKVLSTIADPNALTGVDTGAIAKRT